MLNLTPIYLAHMPPLCWLRLLEEVEELLHRPTTQFPAHERSCAPSGWQEFAQWSRVEGLKVSIMRPRVYA